jgi:two-component system, NarL family, sensor histidine kinase LiaS
MNYVQRQLFVCAGFSLLIFLFTVISFWIAYPLDYWSVLWEQEIIDIPFILFSASVSIISGGLFGLLNGLTWRKQIQTIDTGLRQLELGQKVESSVRGGTTQDLDIIWGKMEKIQKQMTEQVKVSQKLASEKVENDEKRIQEIVSQERNRLARELHDSVSQQLFAASMLMSAITETRPVSDDRETKQLKMIEEMIHQSQLEMRALLLHLRPVALNGKSLQEGIQELLGELSMKVPMKIQWKVESIPLDKGVEDHLFRILQESVSNTLRHAKANSFEVLLIERDNLIILRVSDDGIGFDVEASKAGSYGLQNIYERAVEIGAAVKIVSVKNKGTRLEVKVPKMSDEGEEND